MLKATNKVGQCSESLAECGQSRLLEDSAKAAAISAGRRQETNARRPVYSISRMTQMAWVSIAGGLGRLSAFKWPSNVDSPANQRK